jgi:hypothetical protein
MDEFIHRENLDEPAALAPFRRSQIATGAEPGLLSNVSNI